MLDFWGTNDGSRYTIRRVENVRNEVRWTTTVVLTVAAMAAFSLPAMAATTAPAGRPPRPMADQPRPPSCVSVRPDSRGIHTWTFHIDNGCPTTQRVKIDLSLRLDSECLIVPAESTVDWKGEIRVANQFEGLVAC